MKKLLLLLTALMTALLLVGCSVTDFLSSIDTDKLSDWLFSVTEVELDPVMTGQEIKESLPTELCDVTVGGTALGCQVTHLAIRERDTNTTRQTDEVTCEVELEGDGIDVHFLCTLYYTYTTSGGWGLTDWSIDSSTLDLEVGEGALTDQLEAACLADLEEDFDEGSVTYQSSTWDKDDLVCSVVMTVNAVDNYLLTQGYLTISAALTLNLSDGLSFSWDVTEDDSTILYGVDIVDTAWFVTGTVDTTAVQLAVSVSDTDIERQTVTISAVAAVLEEGDYSYSIQYTDDMTLTYSVGKDGTITFTFDLGEYSWDCCFDAEDQWARIDSSYINSMELQAKRSMASEELRELLDEDADTEEVEALEYDTNTSGYTYSASDGTLVYEMQVKYPQFSGSGVSELNTKIQSAYKSFLSKPQISTDQSDLDELAQAAADGGTTLPYYDELVISVTFNQNNYLSLLYTYTERLEDGAVTYRYESVTYDMLTMEELETEDVYSGSNRELGSLINSYAGTELYSDATVMSYVQTWALGRSGLVFYILEDEDTGACTSVTVPYDETVCLLDPTQG